MRLIVVAMEVKEVADFAPNPGVVGMGVLIMIMVVGMGHESTYVSFAVNHTRHTTNSTIRVRFMWCMQIIQ